MTPTKGKRDELDRIRRVSDMLCTGHAALRDRFTRKALALDLLILGLSSWLVALAFVEPRINIRLTPFDWDSQIWVGALAVGTFFLTIIQLRTNWKGQADGHKRSLENYSGVKREAGYLLAAGDFDEAAWLRVLAKYDMASAVGVEIPERAFLPQKRRHKVKVALSQYLDKHPSASIVLTRVRFWVRDNIGKGDVNGT